MLPKAVLQYHALRLLLLLALFAWLALAFCHHCGTRRVLEHFADALVGTGRAFKVFVCSNLLADIFGLGEKVVSNVRR